MTNQEKIFQEALLYKGVKEVDGIGVNEMIKSWITWAMPWTENEADVDSKYAWCAIFPSRIMFDLRLLPKNKPIIRALDYLKIGKKINEPVKGCFAVLDRGKGKGQVTFFCKFTKDGYFQGFGGNQQNKIGYNEFDVKRVLGYISLD